MGIGFYGAGQLGDGCIDSQFCRFKWVKFLIGSLIDVGIVYIVNQFQPR
ncbi:MAG: hypothetical protein ACI86M_002748 [Saprospiraceae bacterium]|jgi:hypothetical protein